MAYQAVFLTLPTALVRAYYTQQPPVARPAGPELLLFPKSPLLQSLFASLLPYLALEQYVPEKVLAAKIMEAIEILRSLNQRCNEVLADFSEPGKVNTVQQSGRDAWLRSAGRFRILFLQNPNTLLDLSFYIAG